MDPIKEIEELEAEVEGLEKLLLITSDVDERLSIHRRIKAKDDLIAGLWGRFPPTPDNRPIWHRWMDSVQINSIAFGISAFNGLMATMWIAGFYYTPLRHKYAPFTERQMARRERLFHPMMFKGCSGPPLPVFLAASLSLWHAFCCWNKEATRENSQPRRDRQSFETETANKDPP
jgi:hypothetical protein